MGRAESASIEVAILPLAPAPGAQPRAAEAVVVQVPPPPLPPREAARTRSRRAVAAVVPEPSLPAAQRSTASTSVDPQRPASLADLRVAPDLSPAAAAASVVGRRERFEARGVCGGRPPSQPQLDCAVGDTAPPAPAAALQRELQALARSGQHGAAAEAPELHRQLDGSYTYEGSRFSARIDRDGHVSLQDRPVLQSALPIPIMGAFDLTDAVEKYVLDRELYTPQKRRFLEATAGLRAQLSDRDRDRSFSTGRARLLGELERIVASASSSPADKRAAVFALWDDCASDEAGTRGQAITEAFIRERMPVGTPLGFSDVEIAALNQRRLSARRFDPYHAPRASAVAGSAG